MTKLTFKKKSETRQGKCATFMIQPLPYDLESLLFLSFCLKSKSDDLFISLHTEKTVMNQVKIHQLDLHFTSGIRPHQYD